MSYKIVVDSCCELPKEYKNDPRFEIIPLTLIVGDVYEREDNEEFNQREFLDAVAACPTCPKSACPSPERYMQAFETDADHVYAVTLSSKLSGSYNSAELGKRLYCEKYGEKDIYIVDSKSASCGETQLAFKGSGSSLSQGQRQLLAIARVAVADPPVLILDEATSSIDTRTEKIVQDGMDRLMKGRTVFVIAHRLSTIKNSDVIMILDHGRIVERGNHESLLAKKGMYYQLYTGKLEQE